MGRFLSRPVVKAGVVVDLVGALMQAAPFNMVDPQPTTSTVPSPGTSPAAGPSRWLEGGVVVLNGSTGQIRNVSDALSLWLECAGEVKGPQVSFWSLLLKKHEGWSDRVDQLRHSTAALETIDLALPGGSEDEITSWYRLELAREGDLWFIRLNSVLPPRAELAESGWDAHLAEEASRRDLFIRLMRAETQLDRLTECWPGVIFSQRPDYSFVYVSPRIEEMTGVPLDDWRHQPRRFWQVIHEADAVELQQQIQRAVASGEALTGTFRLRNLKTGRISYVQEQRQPLLSRGGLLLGYEGVWLDVTRQTIAEKRLCSAAWKETLAVLTMGLAHDFSNVMAGIHSLSESFLSELEGEHPFHEGLGLIKENSMHASQLVHRIINLHLGKTGDRNYHDLNEIIGELNDLVRRIIPRRIRIHSELYPEPLPVYADAVEFRQVIINLALNAADAMSDGGQLIFRTSLKDAWPEPEHYCGTRPRTPCICLEVADTGCGIRSKHLENLFDPFFTTKAVNKGSGLGLYNARLFVEKHHGAISVESTDAAGTTFVLWLPRADFSEEEREDGDRVDSTPAPRRALVLLGPDGSFLDETTEFLRIEGYQVIPATSPEGVGDLLRTGDYPYDGLFILCDSSSTELNAPLSAWRETHPDLRVVLKPVGLDGDELDQDLIDLADLVVTAEMPQPVLAENLRAALQKP